MAKPIFTPAQIAKLVEVAKEHRPRFRNQTDMAKELNLSQPALSALLLHKWKPGLKTAEAIARLAGRSLREVIGEYADGTALPTVQDGSVSALKNLETCIAFFATQKRWSRATLAAARAGLWADDVAPPAWEQRLDDLERVLSSLVKAEDPLG